MDETQRFILEWLKETSTAVQRLLNYEVVRNMDLTIKLPHDQQRIDMLRKTIAKLAQYSAKEVKPDGGTDQIDP